MVVRRAEWVVYTSRCLGENGAARCRAGLHRGKQVERRVGKEDGWACLRAGLASSHSVDTEADGAARTAMLEAAKRAMSGTPAAYPVVPLCRTVIEKVYSANNASNAHLLDMLAAAATVEKAVVQKRSEACRASRLAQTHETMGAIWIVPQH